MVSLTCTVSGLGTGKIISSAVRTGWKGIFSLCKSWDTIGREAKDMMRTFYTYRKNRRLMQYFFRLKNLAV